MEVQSRDRYHRFYRPILDILRELGGSARKREVMRIIVDRFGFTEADLAVRTPSGPFWIEDELNWARYGLAWHGLLESSGNGVWALTEKGLKCFPDPEEAKALWREMRRGKDLSRRERLAKAESAPVEETPQNIADEEPDDLLKVMQSLSPSGFERLCQRILREAGFTEVAVTGRAGDGGIDGHGVLQLNELVSFRVLFQCKRFQGSVGPGLIRDFRGAMMGRTDKGIFLTTGSFTRDAEREALREGAPPIELVDGEKLAALMARLSLGVTPRTVYDVDHKFFEEYR